MSPTPVRESSPPPISPYFAIVVGIIAVSFAAIFIRYANLAGAPALAIAAWRLTIAALLLAGPAWASSRGEMAALSRRDLRLGALAGVLLAAHFASWISSLEYTSVASSVALVTMYPLFAAVASALFFHERLPVVGWVGVIVSVLGSVIIAFSDINSGQPDSLFGDALALLGAATGAGYFLVGRALRRRLSLLSYVTLTYGTAAVTLVGLALVLRVPLFGYSPAVYGLFFLLAAVPQLIGHTAFNYALRYVSATFVTVTVVGEPIGATILAVLFFGERPGPVRLLGIALILVGIVLVTRAEQITARSRSSDDNSQVSDDRVQRAEQFTDY